MNKRALLCAILFIYMLAGILIPLQTAVAAPVEAPVSVGSAGVTAGSLAAIKPTQPIKVMAAESKLSLSDKRMVVPVNKPKKLKALFKNKRSRTTVTYTSSNKSIATVDKNGKIKGKAPGKATITATTPRGQTAKCAVIVTAGIPIAITYDDGPHKTLTPTLLKGLSKRGARATFFVLGQNVTRYPATTKRIIKGGHEIGSHSYSHPNMVKLSTAKQKSQIEKTKKAVKKATGTTPTLFRPPYGSYNKTVLRSAGLPGVYWSVDTEDWKNKSKKQVETYIVKHAKEGAIILLHDIHKNSVSGSLSAIDKLKKRGYEFYTVSELLTLYGRPPQKMKMYFSAVK